MASVWSAKFLYGNWLRHFAKFWKNLSWECYGVKEISENFYPDWETASKRAFRGPSFARRGRRNQCSNRSWRDILIHLGYTWFRRMAWELDSYSGAPFCHLTWLLYASLLYSKEWSPFELRLSESLPWHIYTIYTYNVTNRFCVGWSMALPTNRTFHRTRAWKLEILNYSRNEPAWIKNYICFRAPFVNLFFFFLRHTWCPSSSPYISLRAYHHDETHPSQIVHFPSR